MRARTERIERVSRANFIQAEILRCAAAGNVNVAIEIVRRDYVWLDIVVEVSADNAGSVADFCESLLSRIAAEDKGDSHVLLLANTYVKRVQDWNGGAK